jgi:hypothetical protein
MVKRYLHHRSGLGTASAPKPDFQYLFDPSCQLTLTLENMGFSIIACWFAINLLKSALILYLTTVK